MNKKILILLAAVAIGLFVWPRIAKAKAEAEAPAPPAMPTPVAPKKKKKTIFGKLVGGVTELSAVIPGPVGAAINQGGTALGQFTK